MKKISTTADTEKRIRIAKEEADMSISAGTAREWIATPPKASQILNGIIPSEMSRIRGLVKKYGKSSLIRLIKTID